MNEPYKILVVDDEKEILEIIGYVLGSPQIKIFSAPDPFAADLVLKQHEIHLIVSDEIFPGTRGQPWISKLKKKYDHMQYIVFSGQLDLADICSGTNCRFIYKPDFQLLQKAIKEIHQEWLINQMALYSKEAK